ncbi:MAG: ribosomal RNA small subunit methyltransferase A [Deltaproteobacteria bacterium]|nr:ribosomal RNA small subunit methyltransferase A [Deltaproteobacteria bacterium]
MTSPQKLLHFWNIPAKKQFGQHFLANPATAEMIVARSRISSEDIVLEIGSGLGALTIPVARAAGKVYAVEKDRQIMELLKVELIASNISNVELIEKNILEFDIEALAENAGRKVVVMGNLPYNISSQILFQMIMSRCAVSKAILMFQKELAQRITAKPNSKDYGRLTVMLHYCANTKKLAEIKASLFFPKPRVDSEVLEITFNDAPEYTATNEAFFFRVIKAAFSKRRKTLKNALAGSDLEMEPKTAAQILEGAGIDPSRRAETLSVQEFVKLSNYLGDKMKAI